MLKPGSDKNGVSHHIIIFFFEADEGASAINNILGRASPSTPSFRSVAQDVPSYLITT